jgi:hypothetical protein
MWILISALIVNLSSDPICTSTMCIRGLSIFDVPVAYFYEQEVIYKVHRLKIWAKIVLFRHNCRIRKTG